MANTHHIMYVHTFQTGLPIIVPRSGGMLRGPSMAATELSRRWSMDRGDRRGSSVNGEGLGRELGVFAREGAHCEGGLIGCEWTACAFPFAKSVCQQFQPKEKPRRPILVRVQVQDGASNKQAVEQKKKGGHGTRSTKRKAKTGPPVNRRRSVAAAGSVRARLIVKTPTREHVDWSSCSQGRAKKRFPERTCASAAK